MKDNIKYILNKEILKILDFLIYKQEKFKMNYKYNIYFKYIKILI